jgi:hypothetical protein
MPYTRMAIPLRSIAAGEGYVIVEYLWKYWLNWFSGYWELQVRYY